MCSNAGGVVHIKEGDKISRYTHILFDYLLTYVGGVVRIALPPTIQTLPCSIPYLCRYLLIYLGGVIHIKEGGEISRSTHILFDYLLIYVGGVVHISGSKPKQSPGRKFG